VIDIESALRILAEGGVEFIVVGGVAARAHGSARFTSDLAVVDGRTQENIERAAGRPKDFEAIAELEALREEGDAPH
jgi:hypothetical protein